MPPARLVPALAMIRLLAIRTFSLCWLVSGAGRSGRADPDRAVAAAVVLDDVVRDLQVAGVGVGEDRAALGDDVGRQAGRPAADLVDVAREALLVAAADVEAVDAGRVGVELTVGKALPPSLGEAERDDRAVVDVLVAVPGQADRSWRTSRSATGLSPPKAPPSMIEPGTRALGSCPGRRPGA